MNEPVDVWNPYQWIGCLYSDSLWVWYIPGISPDFKAINVSHPVKKWLFDQAILDIAMNLDAVRATKVSPKVEARWSEVEQHKFVPWWSYIPWN